MGISIVRQGDLQKYNVTTGSGTYNMPAEDVTALYGPGWPIAPISRPEDSDAPRSIDYPVGINYTLQPRVGYGLFPAMALKAAYNNVTEVSNPVNLIIRILCGFTKQLKDKKTGKKVDDHPFNWLITEPDPLHHIPFNVWMTWYKKSAKIYAAPAFHYHRDGGGKIDALEYIDGSTLFLITNAHGYVPEPDEYDPQVKSILDAAANGMYSPNMNMSSMARKFVTKAQKWAKQNKGPLPVTTPGYVQVIKGIPFSFWDKDQMYFMPEPPAQIVDSPYGETYIERAWTWINTIALIVGFHLGYYRTGNTPEGLMTMPKDMFPTMGKLAIGEREWNARQATGTTTAMARTRWVPDGTKYVNTKRPDFPKDLYRQANEEILYALGVPTSAMGEKAAVGLGGSGKGVMMGAAHDITQQIIEAEKESLEDALNAVLKKAGVDDVTAYLDYPKEEIDPQIQAQQLAQDFEFGLKTLNDVMTAQDLAPIGNPKDKDNAANFHIRIIGTTAYAIEKMKFDENGMLLATPPPAPENPNNRSPFNPQDPGGNAAQADGKENLPPDPKTVKKIMQSIEESGGKSMSLNGIVYSLPPVAKYNENHDEQGRFAEGTDFQGRPLGDRSALRGGNLTQAEANIMEVAQQHPLARFNRSQVDAKALQTFKDNGLVRSIPNLMTTNKDPAYEFTMAGQDVRNQYFRVKDRIALYGKELYGSYGDDDQEAGAPEGCDPAEYAMGMKEEQEHATTVHGDQAVIRNIVLDHLKEDPKYYTHLKEIGKSEQVDSESPFRVKKADITDHDGAMIAIFIPDKVSKQLRKIADGLGLPKDAQQELAENMHVTLAFLPDTDQAKDESGRVLGCIQSTALGYGPLKGNIQGYGVFNGKDGTHVLFATLDIPDLPFIRTEICNALEKAGVKYAKDHGFVPHITLAYFPDDWEVPAGFSVPDIDCEIDGITFALGDKLTTITLQEGDTRLGKRNLVKVDWPEYLKHCGVCPEDKAYFGAPISAEVNFDFSALANGHINDIFVVAMTPKDLPSKPALWFPAGGENLGINAKIGGLQYRRREASWLLDQSLGFHLVPLAYVSQVNGEDGCVVWYTMGGEATNPKPAEEYAPEWIERAAVFDYIDSEQDRPDKLKNYLSHPDDHTRLILIDNSFSWVEDPTMNTKSVFTELMVNKPLSPETLKAIKMCLGDKASWVDIQDLIGKKVVDNARARAQQLLDDKKITPEGKVKKFNPNHDEVGRFAEGEGGSAANLKNAVSTKLAEAAKNEPHITNILQSVADRTGGKMDGLDNRLKSPDSLERKNQTESRIGGMSYEDASKTITDANRYTMVYSPDKLVAGEAATAKALKDQGFERYDHKASNYFGQANKYGYEGYNTVWHNPQTGATFELQFHTPDSLSIKESVHPYYATYRTSSDPAQRESLMNQMASMWNYQRPAGYENLTNYMR